MITFKPRPSSLRLLDFWMKIRKSQRPLEEEHLTDRERQELYKLRSLNNWEPMN